MSRRATFYFNRIASKKGKRFIHTYEGGRWNPYSMPAIRNAMNKNIVTEMTKGVQELAWGVIHKLNPLISINKFENLHWKDRAMNNGIKNGYNSSNPLSNWVEMKNLTSPNPNYDKTRGYAGQWFQGDDVSGGVLCVPGKHMIDPRNLPTVDEVIQNRWYSIAIELNSNLSVGYFAQGQVNNNPYEVVAYLWISKEEAFFPESWIQDWDEPYYPEPLKMYLPFNPDGEYPYSNSSDSGGE